MEKLTNKKAIEFVLGLQEVQANEEIKEKFEKMLEQLDKKNGKKKPTKVQEENVEIKEALALFLEEIDKPVQIKEIVADARFDKYTPQKISALIRQLVADGLVKRVEEKRIAKFMLA